MKRILMFAGFALFAFALWFWWWCQPERQVRRAQGRLLEAVESADFDALGQIIADDYRDGWQHDKAFVLETGKKVFTQFLTMSIEREDTFAELASDGKWIVREKLTMKGLGGPVAIAIRERVNQLRQPFTTTWRKRSWKPWDWELTSVEQPEISTAETDVSW
jgi:hypothetical protein